MGSYLELKNDKCDCSNCIFGKVIEKSEDYTDKGAKIHRILCLIPDKYYNADPVGTSIFENGKWSKCLDASGYCTIKYKDPISNYLYYQFICSCSIEWYNCINKINRYEKGEEKNCTDEEINKVKERADKLDKIINYMKDVFPKDAKYVDDIIHKKARWTDNGIEYIIGE